MTNYEEPSTAFPKESLQEPVFTSDIFLAILSDINEVDEKAMQTVLNELYFLPLILVKCMEGKIGLSLEKRIHSNQGFAAHERSLNVLTDDGQSTLQ